MKNIKNNNKGFTLAELVVILVILSLLFAILIPTVMGYIDEARNKKYLPNAKSCLDAAQAMFSKQYGLNDVLPADTAVVSGSREQSKSANHDQDITTTKFAEDLLKLAGLPDGSPYLFMVGVGSAVDPVGTVRYGRTLTEADKYTIYYAVYMEDANSKAWYYYNGSWSTRNPRYHKDSSIYDANNIIVSGPDKGIRIQYYLIANRHPTYKTSSVDNGKFWDWLRDMK